MQVAAALHCPRTAGQIGSEAQKTKELEAPAAATWHRVWPGLQPGPAATSAGTCAGALAEHATKTRASAAILEVAAILEIMGKPPAR
jgi:hypothetical protein